MLKVTSRYIRNLCDQLLYIAQERVGLLWVAKGIAKTMAQPSVNELTRCNRAARSVPEGDAGLRVHAGTTT